MNSIKENKADSYNKLGEIANAREGKVSSHSMKFDMTGGNRNSVTQETVNNNSVNSRTKKKGKVGKIILRVFLILLLIILIGAGGLYIYAGSVLKNIGLNVTPLETIQFVLKGFNLDANQNSDSSNTTEKAKIPQLKRDSTGRFSNLLLVGIDTRPTDGKLINTDSMMVISYDYEDDRLMMISIPRDIYIKAPDQPSTIARINSMYGIAEKKEKGTGLEYLGKSITSITGIEIQYSAMINLAGFTKIIDAIGGIDVKIEKSFTDYRYPDPKTNIENMVVKFVAGTEHMSGERALIFARSRHSMDNMEGTDFARAKRQQKIMLAVKDKLLSSEVFLNPQKILELIAIVEENVKFSGYTLEDIEAGLNLFVKAQDSPTYSFVLDPTIGNWKVLTEHNVVKYGYGIGPTKGNFDYSDLKKYVKAIQNHPRVYQENPIIAFYDTGYGKDNTWTKLKKVENELPFLRYKFGNTIKMKTEGNFVFDHAGKANDDTVKDIIEILGGSKEKPVTGATRNFGEGVSVYLGKVVEIEDTNATSTATTTNSSTSSSPTN